MSSLNSNYSYNSIAFTVIVRQFLASALIVVTSKSNLRG